ncbi:MAG TPA: zinc ribbon domain-containing protein [Blastocatellia bacterium]|nr:zinc ribbon domain-containing protein [Blastocatellia bacterium]
MPIYEYTCEKCGEHLEVLQKMGAKPLTRCTKCKGKLHKVVSKSSFQLKGSGWYVTDYAKGSGAPKSDGAASSKADTKSESKTESKPETAPASTTATPGSGKKTD